MIYFADDKLEKILLKHGFINFTENYKSCFKKSKQSSRRIIFDNNILILRKNNAEDILSSLTEFDLRLLLFYFKVSYNDMPELFVNRKFNLKTAHKRLNYIKEELTNLKKYKLRKPRQQRIERILDFFNQVKI